MLSCSVMNTLQDKLPAASDEGGGGGAEFEDIQEKMVGEHEVRLKQG